MTILGIQRGKQVFIRESITFKQHPAPCMKDGTTLTSAHVEFSYNKSISADTGLPPLKVPMNRLLRLPLSIVEHHTPEDTKASPTITWNTVTSSPTANGVRMRWYAKNTPSRSLPWSTVAQSLQTHSNNSLYLYRWLSMCLHHRCYHSPAHAKILKTKLSLNWTSPFTIFAVSPTPSDCTPDDRSLGRLVALLGFP